MKRYFCFILFLFCILCGCGNHSTTVEWGSFTSDKTFSYDKQYYAIQEVFERDGIHFIEVKIYSAEHILIDTFQPARASDFWGICWEKDTYNIWIQSADLGVLCYSCNNEAWSLNSAAVRPEYIISKYDSAFSNGHTQ